MPPRIRGAGALPSIGLAVLRELLVWRDEAAQRHDAPPRSLIKDEVLLEMARHPVKSVDALAKVRGLPRPVEDDEGKNIVAAVARGGERRPRRGPGGSGGAAPRRAER